MTRKTGMQPKGNKSKPPKRGRKQQQRSVIPVISGRGAYSWGDFKNTMHGLAKQIPKGTFSNIGGAIGGAFGQPGLGSAAGGLLSKITGYGSYQVSSNSLMRTGMALPQDSVPTFVNTDHTVRITHREYIADLVAPAAPGNFNLQSWNINPTNGNLFPWLTPIARNYQEYRICGMVVEYKSMYSDYSTGPLGTVTIATNYNVTDQLYASKREMENSEFACSTKPSISLMHPIECSSKQGRASFLFTRPYGSQVGTNDNRFFDWGMVQVATQGMPASAASQTLGELWVSYDIELVKPVLGNVTGSETLFNSVSTNLGFSNMVYSATANGSNYVLTDANSIPLSGAMLSAKLAVDGANTATFLKPGVYTFFNGLTCATPPTTTGPSYNIGSAAVLPTELTKTFYSYGATSVVMFQVIVPASAIGSSVTLAPQTGTGAINTNIWKISRVDADIGSITA